MHRHPNSGTATVQRPAGAGSPKLPRRSGGDAMKTEHGIITIALMFSASAAGASETPHPTAQDSRIREAIYSDAEVYRIVGAFRSEEHTSELTSLMRISYAVFCLTKKHISHIIISHINTNI